MSDGSLTIMAFKAEGRSPTLPEGAEWGPAGTWRRPANQATIDAELAKAFPGDPAGGRTRRLRAVSWRIIPANYVPTTPEDRAYRDALTDLGTLPLAHNIQKARDIHRDKIRRARARKFADLDTAMLRAVEADDKAEQRRIGDVKQRLRDLPADPAIDQAQTIEQLKAFWPADLT